MINDEKKYIGLVVSFEQAGYRSIFVDKANELLVESLYQGTKEQLPKNHWPVNPEKEQNLN